uniref:Uncharacterized protein n=1 Tax=Myoviridae sp. ctMne5 TaxID=2825089 RepID=A0A8S5TZW4_9CAUD|nr:MAG TPA: hypothetical protein [Myoviridae sp. ctMne5]
MATILAVIADTITDVIIISTYFVPPFWVSKFSTC